MKLFYQIIKKTKSIRNVACEKDQPNLHYIQIDYKKKKKYGNLHAFSFFLCSRKYSFLNMFANQTVVDQRRLIFINL
jgi:hypothetical protein